MASFSIYPAIDLRQGNVVRLREGDPGQQTLFSTNPDETAEKWINAGARWLHVVNLDGAFGEPDTANKHALELITSIAKQKNVNVQFGGGIRSLEGLDLVFSLGITRAILGTVVIEKPELLKKAIETYGSDRIGVSLDARDGIIQIRGWQRETGTLALDLAKQLKSDGLCWLVFTDIARDGLQTGINLDATVKLAHEIAINVIASGGVRDWNDVRSAKENKLSGIIIGRALYEGKFDPPELFSFEKGEKAC